MFSKNTRCYFCLTTVVCLMVVTLGLEASASEKTKPRIISMQGDTDSQYCLNIKDEAQEKRYALKTKELHALKKEIERRISVLEEKRLALELWQGKRDSFVKKANKALVEIYSKMKPDAAAARLEILDVALAASIVLKLSSRKAGVILNEMKVKNAANVTQVIALSRGAGDRK